MARRSSSPRESSGAGAGGRRARLVGFVVVLALILLGGSLWRWGDREPVVERDGAPSWSPDGSRLVFAVERGAEPADVYVMNADGTARRALTDDPANDTSPAFSPDGRTIAFESDRDGNSEIYVMDADGGNVRRLTDDPAHDAAPAWSPDGRRIAFMSDRNARASADIYTMAPNGSDVRRITDDLANWAPQYSPDGRKLAIQVNRDIVVVDLETGERTQLTSTPNDGMNPTWSPDGQRIAFVTTRERRPEIHVMGADGSSPRPLVAMPGGAVIDPRWSPDGSRVAFVFVPTTGEEAAALDIPEQAIYTVDVSSGRLTRVSP